VLGITDKLQPLPEHRGIYVHGAAATAPRAAVG
jgi:hypothetical protein